MQPAVRVSNLSKRYVLGEALRHDTLYDQVGHLLKAPLRRWRGPRQATVDAAPSTDLWALRDVGFEIRQGEVTGVIGRNGAGKSTLLKILSRITAPTQGRVEIRGRLASLLEVGTGFHPELSGRENIFLNGAILGMTRTEVARKFDEIVAFAEVDRFVDTPVKNYSSGMYVRLAFAVAAHLETDVLLVDEVLAVGDASFQRKSLGKMSAAARSGRTVFFVSHNLGAVRNLCTRALLLEGGRLAFDGATDEAIARYERSFSAGGLDKDARLEGPLGSELRIDAFTCRQHGADVQMIDPLAAFELEIGGESMRDFDSLEFNIAVFRDGTLIGSCYDTPHEAPMRRGRFLCSFRFPAGVFRPGRYTIGAGATAWVGAWAWARDLAALDFAENLGGLSAERAAGLIAIPCEASRIQP